jgi:hypothetical protein
LAEVPDANGFRKLRPVVVVTPTADISTGRPLDVVAVTTRLPTPLPEDHVPLPWDREGKARSGLRRKCAAVAGWPARIATGDVQEVIGVLPGAVIKELLAKIAALRTLPPADAASDDSSGDAPAGPK